MEKIIISAAQFDIKDGNVERNIMSASDLIEKAAHKKSKIIVLPEMWVAGFSYKNIFDLASQYSKKILDFLSYMARRDSITIVAGSIPEISGKHLFNTCFTFNSDGKIIGTYRKVHLFSVNDENKYFEPGKEIRPFNSMFGKMGTIICYDIRFPEITRKLSVDGISILLVPAQFPYPRKEHWETLLRARAIENEIFVIGCNRVGNDERGEYFGGSLIINPYGEIIEEGTSREGLVTAEINLAQIRQARERIPVYDDRQPDAYK